MPTDDITLQTYQKQAARRDAVYSNGDFLKPEATEFLSRLVGRRILEIGCGTGRDAKFFAHLDYVGTDLCYEFLEIAAQKNPELRFMKADLYNLPFGEGTFDGVWAAAVYLHVPPTHIDGALQELRRVIRPGGIAWLSVYPGADNGYVGEPGLQRYFKDYNPDELKGVLETAGFTIESLVTLDARPRGAAGKRTHFLNALVRK